MAIYAQGTVDLFKPEIWSGRLKSNLQTKLVYGDLCNRDYEGEISALGDTVHVNNIGRITVSDYVGLNTDIAARETLTDGVTTLTITEAKTFNFGVDDIDKAQSKGNLMEEAMKEAGYALANDTDKFIAGLYAGATNGADLADAATTNKGKFYDLLVSNRQKFQEMDVPIDELTVVIAPWMESLLLLDARFIPATVSGDNVVKNGTIGRAAGTTIRVSNNVPIATVTANQVLTFAGKKGISLANQISKTEAYRPENAFIDAVKGLHVYGAKVMRPEFVICSVVTNA